MGIRRYVGVRLTVLNPFSKRRLRPWPSRYTDWTKDVLKGPSFEIGEYTYGVPAVTPFPTAKLQIGKFWSIANGATIDLGWSHRTDLPTTYPMWGFPDQWPEAKDLNPSDVVFAPKGDVVIGKDVWIGRDALILSPAVIGDGAVIGARAVVTRDVEPYSVVAGNPARVIRKRFDDDTIQRLLKLKWWDWPVEKINKNVHLICSNNLKGLLSSEDT